MNLVLEWLLGAWNGMRGYPLLWAMSIFGVIALVAITRCPSRSIPAVLDSLGKWLPWVRPNRR